MAIRFSFRLKMLRFPPDPVVNWEAINFLPYSTIRFRSSSNFMKYSCLSKGVFIRWIYWLYCKEWESSVTIIMRFCQSRRSWWLNDWKYYNDIDIENVQIGKKLDWNRRVGRSIRQSLLCFSRIFRGGCFGPTDGNNMNVFQYIHPLRKFAEVH